jgi:hypothetical protein
VQNKDTDNAFASPASKLAMAMQGNITLKQFKTQTKDGIV